MMDMEVTSVVSKKFVMPDVEIARFDIEDSITASTNTGGGFYGEWDDNLPEIDF